MQHLLQTTPSGLNLRPTIGVAALRLNLPLPLAFPEDVTALGLQLLSFEKFDAREECVVRTRVGEFRFRSPRPSTRSHQASPSFPRCVLSDGLHIIRALVPFHLNDSFLDIAEENSIIQLDELKFHERDGRFVRLFSLTSSQSRAHSKFHAGTDTIDRFRLLSLTKFKIMFRSERRIGAPIDLDAPKSTTRLPFLPPEIISLILAVFTDRSDSSKSYHSRSSPIDLGTLYRCALVSSSWNVSRPLADLLLFLPPHAH